MRRLCIFVARGEIGVSVQHDYRCVVRHLSLSICRSVVGSNRGNCENHVQVGQQEVSIRVTRSLTSIGPGLFLLSTRHACERVRLLPFWQHESVRSAYGFPDAADVIGPVHEGIHRRILR